MPPEHFFPGGRHVALRADSLVGRLSCLLDCNKGKLMARERKNKKNHRKSRRAVGPAVLKSRGPAAALKARVCAVQKSPDCAHQRDSHRGQSRGRAIVWRCFFEHPGEGGAWLGFALAPCCFFSTKLQHSASCRPVPSMHGPPCNRLGRGIFPVETHASYHHHKGHHDLP